MRDIPIIFPISLVVILVLTFFTGAYAISENALQDSSPVYSVSAPGVRDAADFETSAPAAERDWYQKAAIWVCPLH